jgi:small subunit ribosomal protein S16
MGKKKQPTYRLVAADSRSPRDGRFLEVLGTYEPRGASRAAPETVLKVDNDKAVNWLQRGAQPTERVEKLLRASGAWATFTGQPAGEPEVPARATAAPDAAVATSPPPAAAAPAPAEDASEPEAPPEPAPAEAGSAEA